jgi:hypothetical protein
VLPYLVGVVLSLSVAVFFYGLGVSAISPQSTLGHCIIILAASMLAVACILVLCISLMIVYYAFIHGSEKDETHLIDPPKKGPQLAYGVRGNLNPEWLRRESRTSEHADFFLTDLD